MKLIKNLIAVVAALAATLGLTALVLVLLRYRPFILTTQSMEPLYTQGSLCWVDTNARLDSLKIGDALVYRSPANSLVLHRLVDIQDAGQGIDTVSAVMQGDANDLAQNVELTPINFIGREAFTIPRLGSFVDRLRSIVWIAVALFVLLACVPWESIKRETA